MPKVDLHTHSIASPDGSIKLSDYREALESEKLDVIAVTDHNNIENAIRIQTELGEDKIIVGEEISTRSGDIIGLYLTKLVEPNQTLEDTVKAVKDQNGLVYIPHPFETVRKGITIKDLDKIKSHVDIIEIQNGRAFFQNFSDEAIEWAGQNNVSMCGSSDSHRPGGLGKTYTAVTDTPGKTSIKKLMKNPEITYYKPNILDVLAPKLNRIANRLKGS